LKIDR
jgi:hypothetical protein